MSPCSINGLGIQPESIHERGNPLILILIAFVFVLLFLGALAFIAHTVVKG
ncbi:hypothetical protein JJB11_17660 [Ramlibacter ginsenosidimutans]|uniref:Uncharacterized protein n=1 Tax=Ramlibacter ginsenosidimutans TaxID=502333 RepID=A0A934TUY0_9BURK|nr:hypothetical protein [Ramlibacter ginsenosidimutans]MBK6007929.1 hypothetical protein [Ramlibacter ginsenosidimutans]